MAVSRRDLLKLAGAAGAATAVPGLARAQALEKKEVTIAVGGQALIYYLPLSIANIKGYFKDEGLDAKVIDFAGGSKALQAERKCVGSGKGVSVRVDLGGTGVMKKN